LPKATLDEGRHDVLLDPGRSPDPRLTGSSYVPLAGAAALPLHTAEGFRVDKDRGMQKAQRAAKRRTTSVTVATKPGCEPLKVVYDDAVAREPKTWNEVEDAFLWAMADFDANVASGVADMGDLQNGKGDFFNDLLALLLENCAGVTLYSRGGVPGLIFPTHNLDVTFPPTGVVQFMLEAKAVGTPKHPGSPKQKPIGRPGSADLDKRVKEAAFKTIDLKAEYARIQAQHGQSPVGGPGGGNLTTWLRSVKPSCYLFIAARVVSRGDYERVLMFARTAGQVLDRVGVYCYEPVASKHTLYRAVPIKDASLDLARVLFEACQDLVGIKNGPPVPEPETLSPAAAAAAIPED